MDLGPAATALTLLATASQKPTLAKTPHLPTPQEAMASHNVAATPMIRTRSPPGMARRMTATTMTTRRRAGTARKTIAMTTITRRRSMARRTNQIAMMGRRGTSAAVATAAVNISRSNLFTALEGMEDMRSALSTRQVVVTAVRSSLTGVELVVTEDKNSKPLAMDAATRTRAMDVEEGEVMAVSNRATDVRKGLTAQVAGKAMEASSRATVQEVAIALSKSRMAQAVAMVVKSSPHTAAVVSMEVEDRTSLTEEAMLLVAEAAGRSMAAEAMTRAA